MKKLFTLIAAALMAVSVNAATVEDISIDFSQSSAVETFKTNNSERLSSYSNVTISCDGALKISNSAAASNNWDLQYQVFQGLTATLYAPYTIELEIKGSTEGKIGYVSFGDWSDKYEPSVSFGTDYSTVKLTCTAMAGSCFLLFQSGSYVGDIYIKSVKVSHESGLTYAFSSIISGGDAEGETTANVLSKESDGNIKNCTIGEAGTGADGTGHAFVVTSNDNPTQNYDTQFFICVDDALSTGDVIKLSFKYRAETAPLKSPDCQIHKDPGTYLYWSSGVTTTFTTEWQSFEKTIVIDDNKNGMKSFAWSTSTTSTSNKYYFDDIVLEKATAKDATGINTVKAAKVAEDGAYYNLSGQRVAKPSKGLYIQNGKKVLVK